LAAGAATAVVVSRIARAQAYPTRPVRLLVGFPPGGGSDVAGRIVANRLSELWGQQIAVENKPGAGGHLTIEVAAHANPDGYTMVLVGGSIPLYGLMIASIHYDPEVDLTPVTLVGTYPNVLAVQNSSRRFCGGVPQRLDRNRFCRKTDRDGRIPLGGGSA
jgi:tripartite-type tricarboxylate transporter receptor subunit TctC